MPITNAYRVFIIRGALLMADNSTAFVGCPDVMEVHFIEAQDARATAILEAFQFDLRDVVLVADIEPGFEYRPVGVYPEPGFIAKAYGATVKVEKRARPPPIAINKSRELLGVNDRLKPDPIQDNESKLPLPLNNLPT